MAEEVKILYSEGSGEIIEKKSRFIATLRPVSTVEEATEFIDEMKKQYWDARHNCSAFVVGEENAITRCSDDGEPSGTAGRPMLEVLLGEEIHNIAVVVTRYFGGVLLGTGGLVRAYQAAVKEGLQNVTIISKTAGIEMNITCEYTEIGKLQYIMAQKGIVPLDTVYADKVLSKMMIAKGEAAAFENEIIEALNGKAVIEFGQDNYFTILDGKTVIL